MFVVTIERELKTRMWFCKIGEVENRFLEEVSRGYHLHGGALDPPMRNAVEAVYKKLLGVESTFCFSGWGAQLTEYERAVVEDREPEHSVIQDAYDYIAREAENVNGEYSESARIMQGLLDEIHKA